MSFSLSRRQFVAHGAALMTASSAKPAWGNILGTPLPIPPLVDGSSGVPIDLKIREGAWSFKPGIKTPTLGINQDYLGPTIRTRHNSELNLNYHNLLGERVAIHGHGLHVPGDVDGGPQLQINPGDIWRPSLSIVQPASTCWYHAHTHGRTGHQVYHGLAGMVIIDDDLTDSLALPDRYGIDDLPIVIQDRTFDTQWRLMYSLMDAGEDGWFGDTVVINGAIAPVAQVPAGKVRLRLLNGANARFYIIAFSDNRTFYKIASDGGLLPSPVPLTTMEMSPGERCEIVVDLSDGKAAELLTLFEHEFDFDESGILPGLFELLNLSARPLPRPSLTLKVDSRLPAHTAPLPNTLASISRPAAPEIRRTREFLLEMDMDEGGGAGQHDGHAMMDMTINGAAMDMNVINERVDRGVWERWRIRSTEGEHPFHVHGCSFLIDQLEGAAPPPDQQGWKDVVAIDDDGWSEILLQFNHTATDDYPYMYHCHILEHEDRGMMGQFTVT